MPRQVVQNFYGYGGGVETKSTMVGAGARGSASGGAGAPMDLDALRYTGFVTSTLQWNVQFDRHTTEVGAVFRR